MTTLALKYRPKTLEQYLCNDSAKDAVRDIVNTGKVPNAILLHGPTGTGKTTLARILTCMLNGTKTLDDGDFEEMNAAEARGVDDLRALVERARYSPVHKYKVIIVDEAHQLTPQAVEAFLKPLEEPPENTLYVLCTTDPQKFPPKIINRCQVIEIEPPDETSLAKHLFMIAKKEKQPISTQSAKALARAAAGSPRSAMYKLQTALQLIRQGKDPKKALDAIEKEEADAEAAVGAILNGMFIDNAAASIEGCLHLPKDIPSAVTSLTRAQWAIDFVLAAKYAKKFVTPNSFPSDFNKRALQAANNSKLSITDALAIQSTIYKMRKEVMFATTSPASAALSVLSTYFG